MRSKSRDTLKRFSFYPRCDFSEKILPIDDDDIDGTECIYDVSHFLWRSGAFAANKKRTSEKWRERAWATSRAKRKVKRGRRDTESFVMSKSIVLAVLAGVFDIEMGRNSLPPPPCFVDVGRFLFRRAEHVVSNSTTGGGG